eukprot:1146966-Pelagomonas_calceolata.AAC.8
MIVNHFGMRQDIQSYSLGGMGCGTGVLGINLIADLLKVWSARTERCTWVLDLKRARRLPIITKCHDRLLRPPEASSGEGSGPS